MNKEDFLAYVASFNPEYATEQTAKDIIKQARKIIKGQLLDEITKESQKRGRYD